MDEAPRRVLFIRHGPTAWNAAGRIQGRRDVALSEHARARLAGRGLPAAWRDGQWHSSPLRRALHTARALGATRVHTDARLVEMDWGEWEGRTLASLRAELGVAMADNEARGLDFRPPGGESPRQVRARLHQWLAEQAPAGPPLLVVTHKGVVRAALSLAAGWDMCRDFPQPLDWSCGQAFSLGPGGALRVAELNVPLPGLAA